MKEKNKQKGITLIALIITIIIMLILVAVTINVLINSNLIGASKTAAKKWQTETDKEKTIGTEIEIDGKKYASIEEYLNPKTTVAEYIAKAEKEAEIGTEANPIYVGSIEELAILAQETNSGRNNFENKWIALARDLDFNEDSSYTDPNATEYESNGTMIAYGDINGDGVASGIKTELTTGKGFLPIGAEDNPFMGNFDGKNKTLSNLYINTVDDYERSGMKTAFIAQIGSNDEETIHYMKNFKIVNPRITGEGNIGGLASFAYNTYFINCQSIDGSVGPQGDHAGGIVGGYACMCKFVCCMNSTKVSSGWGYTGGIVSEADDLIMVDCSNVASVDSWANGVAGGLAGGVYEWKASVEISGCSNSGAVTRS